MNPLRRLRHTSHDDLELALLRSAEPDAPSARSLAGAALAVGLSAQVAAALSGAESVFDLLRGAGTTDGGAAPMAGSQLAGPGASGIAPASGAAAVSLGVLAKYSALGAVAGLVVTAGLRFAWPGSAASSHAAVPPASAAQSGASRASRTKRALAGATRNSVAPIPVAQPSSATTAPALPRRSEVAPLARAAPVRLPSTVPAPRRAAPSSATPSDRTFADRAFVPKQAAPALKEAAPPWTASLPATRAFEPVAAPGAPAASTANAPVAALPAPASTTADAPVTSTAGAPASIAREVALLDQVRRALGEKAAARALSLLDGYDAMPRSGVLDEEATLLRVRAFSALHANEDAARVARVFLERHPESRHARALRTLIERGEADGGG